MAEMTTLVATIYRMYRTSIAEGYENKSPAITSRFELFYDETMPLIEVRIPMKLLLAMLTPAQEHKCWIKFERQS